MKMPALTDKGRGLPPSFEKKVRGESIKRRYSTLTDEQAAAFKERSDVYKELKKKGFMGR
jgi:hypothetical protein